MNYTLHKASERGVAEHGWLHSRFSFSFANWYNPAKMGFGVLRVINDDVIDADSGFDLHPHDNMEIVTIVMEGAVTHGDSMGNEGAIPAGDVQVMSAGTGVVHSEHNNSLEDELKLFQIWILPKERGIEPRYDQKSFGATWKQNALQLLVSPDGRNDSLFIHQNAFIHRGALIDGKTQEYMLHDAEKNGVYLLVVDGSVKIDGHTLNSRDAIGVSETDSIIIVANATARYLLFEVPMK